MSGNDPRSTMFHVGIINASGGACQPNLTPKKRAIVHTIHIGPNSEGLREIVIKLEDHGFEIGEQCTDGYFEKVFETIGGKIFAPQTVEQYGKVRSDPMPTDYDYDKYSFVLVRSYMGPSGTTILTKELSPKVCIDVNYDLLFAPFNDPKLDQVPKVFLFDCARKLPESTFDLQKLEMNLSTKYTKKTFVGFTLPTEKSPDDDLKFFNTFVKNLLGQAPRVGTLQNIFEQTQLELKSEDIQVSQVNNFGSDPIELSFVQNKPK